MAEKISVDTRRWIVRRIALLALLVGFLAPLFAPAPAHAQATRTWVSGVGDDANPCSRTAPCKTFAGAISKTAPAGEIDCLDPGGFGAVTITKSITLNCSATLGSVLVAGTNGVVIAAGAADKVVLRNIQIQGINSGLAGVKITSAAVVSIENCIITEFTQQGISDSRTAGNTKLFVRDTIISNNGGSGIALTATGPNNADITNTNSINNLFGLAVGNGNMAVARRSVFAGNTNSGVETDAGGVLNVVDSSINNNVTGVMPNGTIRLSNSDVSFNTTGFSAAAISYGNNRLLGNTNPGPNPAPAGAASSTLGQQ
jgi:hypothetical protein